MLGYNDGLRGITHTAKKQGITFMGNKREIAHIVSNIYLFTTILISDGNVGDYDIKRIGIMNHARKLHQCPLLLLGKRRDR